MIKTKINLSVNQLKKIRNAYEKQTPVTIRLSYEQISKKGEYDVLLTETQKKRLDNNKKLEKGVLLHLSYEQIKTGGFLPILLAILGAVVATAGGAAAVANSVISAKHQSAEEEEMKRHNREMETIAKNAKTLSIGTGLKAKKKTK